MMMKKVLPAICLSLVLVITASADTGYINDVIRVVLRGGAGTDFQVITTLDPSQEFEVVGASGDWSHIKLPDGREGWLLTRFITREPSAHYLLGKMRGGKDDLLTRLETVQVENRQLTAENAGLKQDLETVRSQLGEISTAHEALKQESAGFLSLKQRYQAASIKLDAMEKQQFELEKKLEDQDTQVMLTGAGILLAGLMIGLLLGIRRRRSASYLYR